MTTVHSFSKLCRILSTVDTLKECVLPHIVDVMNLILSLKNENNGCSWYGGFVLKECAQIVLLRWISCNVYPTSLRTVARNLKELFEEYRGIRKYTNKSPALMISSQKQKVKLRRKKVWICSIVEWKWWWRNAERFKIYKEDHPLEMFFLKYKKWWHISKSNTTCRNHNLWQQLCMWETSSSNENGNSMIQLSPLLEILFLLDQIWDELNHTW